MRKEKKTYLEIIRVIAIFFVLYCHTGDSGQEFYRYTFNPLNYWTSLILVPLSHVCVPLFFMVTGACLLQREETFGYVYRHRVLRMILVIVVTTLIQYYLNYRENPAIGFTLNSFLYVFYCGGAIVQQWFLYTYLGLLLILPILQRLVQSVPKNSWFAYIFMLYLVIYGICPVLEYFIGWGNVGIAIPMLTQGTFYCIMGYYIVHRSGDFFLKGSTILAGTGLFTVTTVFNAYLNHDMYRRFGNAGFLDIFLPIYASVIFTVVRFVCTIYHMPVFWEKIICFLGAGVFGTYLFEKQLREILYPVFEWLNPRIHTYPSMVIYLLCCVGVGIVLSNLIKKIPVVGKLL